MAAGILYWLFQLYPLPQILKAVSMANPWGFGVLALTYFLWILVIDTLLVAWCLARFTRPVPMRELLPARLATYPMALINYAAGQAAFGFFLQRTHKIRPGNVIGLFTLIVAVDLFWVVTFAFIGSFIGEHKVLGVEIGPSVQLVAAIAYALVIAHLVFWLMHWENRVKAKFWKRGFAWLRRKSLFNIFHQARLKDYAIAVALRFPLHAALVMAIWCLMRTFGGTIDLLPTLGNAPIAVLIGVIPISWGGIGTSNKALVDLLEPHVTLSTETMAAGVSTAELILAASLLWMLANYLIKFLLGICFLPRASRIIGKEPLTENSAGASRANTPSRVH